MKYLFAALAVVISGSALAQSYPSKPVRVVVPFPPGGGTDIVARTVTPKMAEILGQPFVVENRAGAGGNIGTEGVDLLHVPYKGAAPAVNDLLGGQVNIMFADVAALLPHIKSGKLKALGIASAKRFEGLPEVPTIAESGVPGFEAGGFLGLVAPAATPPALINALNSAAQKSLALPEVRERLLGLASPPVGGTPEQFGEYMKREIDKWARVIRAANIKPE